ncbi:MAG: hypothetical protein ABTA23_01805 [Solibacillus sp.]|nr:hypothetical protein [Solibacillus silvestris]OBW60019.1 hypothetical protein A9986_02250 [Solibacillus silvestris]
MKSSLRAFGIGLFVAGACMALFDQLPSDSNEKEIAAYEKQVKDYEKQIAELSKQLKELNPVSADPSKVDKQTNNATAENTSVTKKETDSGVVEETIYIYENVSIYTIGQQAEDLGIVANGRELELYLSKPEFARSIQKGAFDLRSDMTIEEIAQVLTGQPTE